MSALIRIALQTFSSVACTAMLMVDKAAIQQELVDKWSITASLSARFADIVVLLADKEEML